MKYLQIIIVTLFFYSCSERTNKTNINIESGELIRFNFDPNQSTDLNEILDKIKLIPLIDLPKGFVVNEILKIQYSNSSFFLLEKDKKKIWCFSESGKFKYCINSIGKGPDEYMEITDFCINENDEELICVDELQFKLLRYNFYSGAPISSAQLEDKYFAFHNVDMLNDSTIVFPQTNFYWENEENKPHNIATYSLLGDYKDCFVPIDDSYVNMVLSFEGLQKNKDIYFDYTTRSSYKLTYLDNEFRLERIYEFDFGKYNYSGDLGMKDIENKGDDYVDKMIKELESSKKVFGPTYYLETNSHVFIGCRYTSELIRGIYCKATKNTIITRDLLVPAYTAEIFTQFPTSTYKDEYFVTIGYPRLDIYELNKKKKDMSEDEFQEYLKSSGMEKMYEKYKGYENPVIGLYKFKEF